MNKTSLKKNHIYKTFPAMIILQAAPRQISPPQFSSLLLLVSLRIIRFNKQTFIYIYIYIIEYRYR